MKIKGKLQKFSWYFCKTREKYVGENVIKLMKFTATYGKLNG